MEYGDEWDGEKNELKPKHKLSRDIWINLPGVFIQ